MMLSMLATTENPRQGSLEMPSVTLNIMSLVMKNDFQSLSQRRGSSRGVARNGILMLADPFHLPRDAQNPREGSQKMPFQVARRRESSRGVAQNAFPSLRKRESSRGVARMGPEGPDPREGWLGWAWRTRILDRGRSEWPLEGSKIELTGKTGTQSVVFYAVWALSAMGNGR